MNIEALPRAPHRTFLKKGSVNSKNFYTDKVSSYITAISVEIAQTKRLVKKAFFWYNIIIM